MFLKNNGISLLIGCCLGTCLGYKLFNKALPQVIPVSTEDKKTTRNYAPDGKIISEVVVEHKSQPMHNPKPRYKISLIPSYSFLDRKFNYAGLYEKKYVLPMIGDCYLGLYTSSKLELGISISKEFY